MMLQNIEPKTVVIPIKKRAYPSSGYVDEFVKIRYDLGALKTSAYPIHTFPVIFNNNTQFIKNPSYIFGHQIILFRNDLFGSLIIIHIILLYKGFRTFKIAHFRIIRFFCYLTSFTTIRPTVLFIRRFEKQILNLILRFIIISKISTILQQT